MTELPVTQATELRDGMIAVARRLADRDCGATQSEMREAQITYLAKALASERPLLQEAVEALSEARNAIAVQPEERFGLMHDGHGGFVGFVRDQMLYRIEATLTRLRAATPAQQREEG